MENFLPIFRKIFGKFPFKRVSCLHAEATAVVQAPVEGAPTITITSEDEHIAAAAEDKNKGAYEQLKELLVSDKQQVRAC